MNQSTKTKSSKVSIAVPVVLYGLDANNKPQAARFPERLCDLAIKAAQQLKLNVLKVATDEFAQVAGRLPVGRINSTGKGIPRKVDKLGCPFGLVTAVEVLFHLPHQVIQSPDKPQLASNARQRIRSIELWRTQIGPQRFK